MLNIETKLLTHAIKIAAFNTTTAMARAIRIHTSYARNDEAFTLARKVLTHTGDIDPRTDGELLIRLDPMPTRRETAAVAELCDHLTAAKTTFPGTDRLLRYQDVRRLRVWRWVRHLRWREGFFPRGLALARSAASS